MHNLKPGPYIIGQPFQNDLMFWHEAYLDPKFQAHFYDKTRELGVLVNSFPYDANGNTIDVWRIVKDSDVQPQPRKIDLTKSIELACRARAGGGVSASALQLFLSDDQERRLEMKCTRGCVDTCEIF